MTVKYTTQDMFPFLIKPSWKTNFPHFLTSSILVLLSIYWKEMSYECYVTSYMLHEKDNDDKKDGDTEDPVEGGMVILWSGHEKDVRLGGVLFHKKIVFKCTLRFRIWQRIKPTNLVVTKCCCIDEFKYVMMMSWIRGNVAVMNKIRSKQQIIKWPFEVILRNR